MFYWGSNDIKDAVRAYFSKMDLKGKRALDVPAGEGVTSKILMEAGAEVEAIDLFPNFFKFDKIKCLKGDLSKLPLNIESNSKDLIICQEGIEHISDQLGLLREFSRLLKEGGALFITTPNYSHLRSRLSYFLLESEMYRRLSPNELDDMWYAEDGNAYMGHLFLIGAQKLRTLSQLSDFELVALHPVKLSWSSFFIGIFTYPLLFFMTYKAYFKNMRKQRAYPLEVKKRVYKEIRDLNLNLKVLLGRHLFVEFKKIKKSSTSEVNFKNNYRSPRPVQDI